MLLTNEEMPNPISRPLPILSPVERGKSYQSLPMFIESCRVDYPIRSNRKKRNMRYEPTRQRLSGSTRKSPWKVPTQAHLTHLKDHGQTECYE